MEWSLKEQNSYFQKLIIPEPRYRFSVVIISQTSSVLEPQCRVTNRYKRATLHVGKPHRLIGLECVNLRSSLCSADELPGVEILDHL